MWTWKVIIKSFLNWGLFPHMCMIQQWYWRNNLDVVVLRVERIIIIFPFVLCVPLLCFSCFSWAIWEFYSVWGFLADFLISQPVLKLPIMHSLTLLNVQVDNSKIWTHFKYLCGSVWILVLCGRVFYRYNLVSVPLVYVKKIIRTFLSLVMKRNIRDLTRMMLRLQG